MKWLLPVLAIGGVAYLVLSGGGPGHVSAKRHKLILRLNQTLPAGVGSSIVSALTDEEVDRAMSDDSFFKAVEGQGRTESGKILVSA